MKRRLVGFGSVALIVGALLVSPVIATTDKVTICHAAGLDGTDHYVRIVVSDNAIFGHFENPGTPLAGHEDDILLQGEQECPTVSLSPTPTPLTSPTAIPTLSESPSPSVTPTPSESPNPSVRASDTPTPSPRTNEDLPNTAMH